MIKQKIEASEQQLIPLTLQERQEQMDRAWDALYNLNVAKGNVVHIGHIYTEDTISKYTSRDASNRIMIQNGDIILIKPKYWNVWWAPIVGWVSHAAIIVNINQVAEIKDSTSISATRSFVDFMNDYANTADQIIIISMGLSPAEWESLSNYVVQNLLWKPYPTWHEFHRSKRWMHKFYCSSLVWRAHYSSGKHLNLDDNGKDIAFPVELAFSRYTWKINIVQQ